MVGLKRTVPRYSSHITPVASISQNEPLQSFRRLRCRETKMESWGRRSTNYPPELRERAVRIVPEMRPEYPSDWHAICAGTAKLSIGGAEMQRLWVHQAKMDAGIRPRVSSEESTELCELRAEVRKLRRTNDILKSMSAFFVELDRQRRTCEVDRPDVVKRTLRGCDGCGAGRRAARRSAGGRSGHDRSWQQCAHLRVPYLARGIGPML